MNKRWIAITILLAGAATALAWFLLRPDPTDVILQAQKKLVNEGTFRVESDFTIDGVFDRPELSFGESRVTLTGRTRTDADRSDPTDVVTSSMFDFSLASGEERLLLNGIAGRADHQHYLRIDEVSDALFPGIEDARGIWMRSSDPFLDLLIRPLEEGLVLNDLDAEGFDEIHRAASVVNIFEHADTLASTEIDGMKTFHYAVTLRQDVAAALLVRIRELRTGLPSEPEDYALALAKVLSWGEATGEVWIGKKDLRFRKIALSSRLSDPTGGARLEGQLLFSRFGEPVTFEIPDAQDVEDVLGRVISGRLALAGDRTIVIRTGEEAEAGEETSEESADEGESPSSDAPTEEDGVDTDGSSGTQQDSGSGVTDSDGDGLSDSEEFIYGSDAWNPDTDGDGWTDGVEVANGKNPVGPGALFGFGL